MKPKPIWANCWTAPPRGETITITRHGLSVARLVPPDAKPRRDVKEVIAELREFRKGIKLRGLSIRKMIEEGRH